MKLARTFLDWHGRLFAKGGRLERLYPIQEALDTFLFTPEHVTPGAPHVRDALDLKRTMGMVIVALIPCILMAMYNTGLQANLAIENTVARGGHAAQGWRQQLVLMLGLGFSSGSVLSCFVHGAAHFLPLLFVTYAIGGAWETLFSVVRRHEINEGFLVTGMLFPLICPPTLPLWQAALGISFGVVLGKEVFGGTGMNFLNPALTARCFLFFAYPQDISGADVWVAGVDGYTHATMLNVIKAKGAAALMPDAGAPGWMNCFLGFEAGSMGETSALACLIGAATLIATRVGSWRTMAGVSVGTIVTASLFNWLASGAGRPAFTTPFWWHMVLGGWAFGTVFMATDPVSSAFTHGGKWIYGFFIGFFVVLVRVINPAFDGGMMLAILLMNVFAPTIDYFIVRRHIRRRAARHATA